MRSIVITSLCAAFVILGIAIGVNADTKPIAVTGKLVRVMAEGGETTGWAVQLDSPLEIEGKSVSRLEVDHDTSRFEKLENQQVAATGNLIFRTGVERGRWPVLEVTDIHEQK